MVIVRMHSLKSKEPVDYTLYYQLLIKRQQELLSRADRDRSLILQQQTIGESSGDMGDQSVLDTNTDYFLYLADRERQELLEIRAALGKIHSGNYGFCEKCKHEMSSDRLQKVPYARFCKTCQSKMEIVNK